MLCSAMSHSKDMYLPEGVSRLPDHAGILRLLPSSNIDERFPGDSAEKRYRDCGIPQAAADEH
jgi:hypothetical protein